MPMTVQQLDDGCVLFDTLYIGTGEVPHGIDIVLRYTKWPDMVYHKHDLMEINYPWEYEINGYNIQAIITPKSDTLNYIIRFGNKKVAFIQDEKALDSDEVGNMNTRYVVWSTIQDAIERRELEGEVILVG